MKQHLIYKIVFTLIITVLVSFGFQNCDGGFSVKLERLPSSVVSSSVPSGPAILQETTQILGFNQADSSPKVKHYIIDDGVVDEEFITSLREAESNPFRVKATYLGSHASPTYLTKWPGGIINIYYDPNIVDNPLMTSPTWENHRLSTANLATLKETINEACRRWTQLAKIECREISNPNTNEAFLTVTQAAVPLSFTNGNSPLCSSSTSCATIGYQGNNGRSYMAILKAHIANRYTVTHELGHVLGLHHEFLRPGRDEHVLYHSRYANALALYYGKAADDRDGRTAVLRSYPFVASNLILSNLPAVTGDFDYASIMNYPIAGNRNADWLAATSDSNFLAFKTTSQFENFYAMNRSALNINATSTQGNANLPGYPSIQDAENVAALYGAPSSVNTASCLLYNGQLRVPHGARIGVYTTQALDPSGNWCVNEARVCNNGQLLGGDRSEGYRLCPLKCIFIDPNNNTNRVTLGYGEEITYYSRATGTAAECNASRTVKKICEFGKMGNNTLNDGYLACNSPSPGPQPPTAPLACEGSFQGCTNPAVQCGSCTQSYVITRQAQTGGAACPYAAGATNVVTGNIPKPADIVQTSQCLAPQTGTITVTTPYICENNIWRPSNNPTTLNSCQTNSGGSQPCIGAWTGCQNIQCGSCTETYKISQQPGIGQPACPYVHNSTRGVTGSTPKPNAVVSSTSCPAPQTGSVTTTTDYTCQANLWVLGSPSTTNTCADPSAPPPSCSYAITSQNNPTNNPSQVVQVGEWVSEKISNCTNMKADYKIKLVGTLNGAPQINTEISLTSGEFNASLVNDGLIPGQYVRHVEIHSSTGQVLFAPPQSPSQSRTLAALVDNSCRPTNSELVCTVNGYVRNVTARVTSTRPVGSITSHYDNEWELVDFQIDRGQYSDFKLQWFCNSNKEWQWNLGPNGNCTFASVYKPNTGGTCDRIATNSYNNAWTNNCNCTDGYGAQKEFPVVFTTQPEYVCEGSGQDYYCYFTRGEGTCDGKPINYPLPPDSP